MSEQDLSEFAVADTAAWRRLLTEEIPRLYAFFLRRWPNRSLAEELVSKTVFDAVRGLESFRPGRGSVQEWLFGIARNNIRLEIRRRASRPRLDGDLAGYLEVIDTEPLPDEVLERQETADIVRAALGRLESKEQQVLRAKYIIGRSARQIAEHIGTTEKAVHSLLYRARESLRAELKREVPLESQGQ